MAKGVARGAGQADNASRQAITRQTILVGVTGSRRSLATNRSATVLINRIFTDEGCKFTDRGSGCSVTLPCGNAMYGAIDYAFQKGRRLHIGAQSAGQMVMVTDISPRVHDGV